MKPLFAFIIVLLVIVSQSTHSFAQDDRKEFFNSSTVLVTWLGIDYSKAKYIGEQGTVDSHEIKDGFNKINNLLIAESDKYDLKAAFKKDEVKVDLEAVLDRNNTVNEERIVATSNRTVYRLTPDSVNQIVKSYKLHEDLTGIGVVFICEAIDKNTEKSTFFVTCFNMKTKEIIFTEKVTGTAGGFGFRNHWARCVYDVLNDMKSKLFKTWQKKYAPAK